MSIEHVLAQPTGATFLRADLHIHSYGASHDVKDAAMTPLAIVQTAEREGLSIISITDHNEIVNVEAALKCAEGSAVSVIPGIELSTSQGHLLCYLPTADALRRLHGQLDIADRGTMNSRCQAAIRECLDLVLELGGFGILAHVDAQTGFEAMVPRASPHKTDVLCHRALLGIELKDAASPIFYTDMDHDADRAKMGRERIARLGLGSRQNIARVLNSDAHALASLGRNAWDQRRITRYKMDHPSFVGLRVALEDSDARVRIEDLVPSSIPRILGIHMEGGFLADQTMQFSSNLNCIIGGRGTGKSTAFEAVRTIAGDNSESKVIDSDVWPDELHLFWIDQAGQKHTLIRRKEGQVENMDDPVAGPRAFLVDCFGQGEAQRISLEAQNDPLALLRYLDKFVDLTEARKAEDIARERLLSLQTEIEDASRQVQLIPQHESHLQTTKQQLAALQKPAVRELIELQRQLATEHELRAQIKRKLLSAKEAMLSGSPKASIQDIRNLADPAKLAVGGTEFGAIVAGAAAYETTIGGAEDQLKEGFVELEATVISQVAAWRNKEAEAQTKVDEKRRELEALKVPFDMSYINKLTRDEAQQEQNVKNLRAWKPKLEELQKARKIVLEERWRARERVAVLRDVYARKASSILRESLSDLQVSLKYKRDAHSPEAIELIIGAMDWRTNQQPRATSLVEDLTVPLLLDALNRRDPTPILALKHPDGVNVFKSADATAILEKLSAPAIVFALERAMLHDLPRLHVSRTVLDGDSRRRTLTKEFSKLSLGQQQSVLLALILSSESNCPLIIDQPEDNLDGEFIYSTLVPVLRRAKELRQVIIVTHNPNVAVLGDAELILVMKAMNDRGEIVTRGSIDHAQTRGAACAILEGAREAFLRRARMYGMRLQDADQAP